MSTVKNYSKMSEFHATWTSVAEFCAAEILEDGVHTVNLGGIEVELYFRGNPLGSNQPMIPVFLNGAIMEREKLEPPFFSGTQVAKSAKTPFIAISDPLVDSDDATNIAWYAGTAADGLQAKLTHLFASMAEAFDKVLLFVGASAGGFAALYYGARLGKKASVFAWNPQTDITKYLPMFATKYLAKAGVSAEALSATDWQEQAKSELAGKIDLVLPPSDQLLKPGKVLILQNRTDWHLEEHLLPWLNQSVWHPQDTDDVDAFAADDNHLVAIVDYAQGHEPIPSMIISFLLADILHSDKPVKDFLNGSDDI